MPADPPSAGPAPAAYPPWVTLVRRAAVTDAPPPGTVDTVRTWLTAGALDHDDLLGLFQAFTWRMVGAGLPVDRTSLHVGTLHPQVYGYAWNWTRAQATCDEVRVDASALQTDAYRRNPLSRVIDRGETVRISLPAGEGTAAASPLMVELAAKGFTEYIALPLRTGGALHNAATLATQQPGGFSADQLASLQNLLSLFALHVDRHIAQRLAGNTLNTYLGHAAGRQVLAGSIQRGAGAPIQAVIWSSDLRGFTALSDRLDGHAMTRVLNAYFDCLAGAVLAEGGDVLKFIGDGLLCVFPFDTPRDAAPAAAKALRAGQAALAALGHLNADDGALPDIAGWRPLRTGIGLHLGTVFFGNVGAPARLDFTVIGQAVNLASRVEGLTKALGRPLLLTAPVADLVTAPLEPLGAHPVAGLAEPIAVFAPQT